MNKIKILAVLLVNVAAFAQTKQLTMSDAVLGLSSNLKIEGKNQLQWIPNQNNYTELVKTSYGNALISTSVQHPKVDTLARSKDFSAIKLKSVPSMNWLNAHETWFQIGNEVYLWNKNNQKSSLLASLPDNAENIEFNAENQTIAYVLNNNLYYTNGKSTKAITTDGKYGITNGKTVHRDEFGIKKGIFFSPKGNLLAFYRMDDSMVEDYPIVDWSSVPAINKNIKYPFAGRTTHQVTIGVYNPKTEKTIFLETGDPKDTYYTCVTWAPDEKSIYIAVLNRDQNQMQLNQYDAVSGKFLKTLFEERNDKYVEPQNPLYFLPNGKEFLWFSQRSGFMHLYRFNTEGKLLNPVTQGDWLVNEIIGFNPKKKQVLFTATKDGAMEKHLYSTHWESGKTQRLDQDPGYHSFNANTEGTYVLDTWSSENIPRKIELLATEKSYKKTLFSSKNPLADYQMPKVENVQLKADDGTALYGKLIYPTNFDSTKKYPVIVYLYNGPHAQLNLNRFPASGNLWYDYMAQHGYVVWVMDGRGSSNRGLKFEQAIFRHLGDVEMDDQMKGITYLKSLPFVDANKMGIHGWSYGGFMTTSFMLRKPEVFKAGVAGGPVLDWSMYEAMYGERYMDSPQTNPEGYAKNLLLDKTQNLKGKLLLIHGTDDNVVVWQHSINFLRNAVSNGVQVDYFVYPGYEHNVRGKDRVHLMQKISDYFDLYLK